jgi:hypothetical protein
MGEPSLEATVTALSFKVKVVVQRLKADGLR